MYQHAVLFTNAMQNLAHRVQEFKQFVYFKKSDLKLKWIQNLNCELELKLD